MLELIIFVLTIAADQVMKFWSVNVLQYLPNPLVTVVDNWFYLLYAENYGDNVSFIRGRSLFMNIVRLLQIALVLYLLIAQRKRLARITRIALVLFLSGLIGNQVNYLFMNYVPDMFIFRPLGTLVFNLADVYVFVAMIILFIRLAFYEGQDFVEWLIEKFKHRGVKGDKSKGGSTQKGKLNKNTAKPDVNDQETDGNGE